MNKAGQDPHELTTSQNRASKGKAETLKRGAQTSENRDVSIGNRFAHMLCRCADVKIGEKFLSLLTVLCLCYGDLGNMIEICFFQGVSELVEF